MSLEAKIEALTQAVQALTAQLQSSNVAPATPVVQAPAPLAPPAVAVPVSVTPTSPVPSQPAAPVMPPAPSFLPSATAAPASSGAPFSDGKGLIDYVMASYKALGPQKGAQIQNVLVGLGYQNINDIKPEHYGALFQGVEQLKAA